MLPYQILGIAVLSLWISPHPAVWNALLAIALGVAFHFHVIDLTGLMITLAASALVYSYYRMPLSRPLKIVVTIAMLLLIFGLLAHTLPGFDELYLYRDKVLTPGAYPSSLYWNFDKPLAGLLLMGWGIERIRGWREWVRVVPTAVLLFLACAGLILVVAMPMGLIRWAPKFTTLSGWFALTNLLFVCVPEEAFFRGFLQQKLSLRLSATPHGNRWSLLITSVIFGVCHFQGGLGLILLSTLAGLFYGYAYQRTGRVEAGILVHFLLNATHYTFFTYPVLRF